MAIDTRETADAARAVADHATSRAEGLQNVAAALGRALGTDEVAEIALREGLVALGAGRGVVGLLEPDGHTIRTLSESGFRQPVIDAWQTFDIQDVVPLAEAIRVREPLIIETSDELRSRYPTLSETVGDGGPAVVVPLIYEDRAVGGMYFRYNEPDSVLSTDTAYLQALGRQCAAALERARLYEAEAHAWREANAAQRRLSYLAEVSEALAAAPDIEAALPRIAALAVPQIADWAGVFLLAPDGSIQLQSLQHRDPERRAQVEAVLDTRPPAIDDPSGPGAAIRTRDVQVVADYPARLAEYPITDAARHTLLATGIRSVMHCPLQGDATVFGALTLATVGDRTFSDADASFGAELGRRIGTTLEKVQLNASLRQRMAELRDRDERLELALAASRTGIWEWNLANGSFLLSDEICRLHGLPLGSQVPSLDAYLELVHPADREHVRQQIAAALDTGVYDTEYRIRLPDGRVRWARGAGRVFLDERREPVRMVGIGQDVTERRAVEEERERLLEAERRAGELGQVFIGIVSHELRTPITTILGGAQLLKRLDRTADAEKRAELVADIEAESEHLYRLTEDLLVLTRVERGGLDLGSEPVLLRRVLEQVVASESARWPEVRISLVAELDLPVVVGDVTYVEQLARNLVANAAKYSGPGAEIEIRATPTDTEIEVRVLDRGPGLAAAEIDRVFDLFYRSPTTAKLAKGAGIGLFVCAQLARAMGGRVWAANRPGGGSEFGFALRQYVGEAEEVSTGGDSRSMVTQGAASS